MQQDDPIRGRAIREFAESRARLRWTRLGFYVGAVVLGLGYIPVAWAVGCLAAIVATDLIDSFAARNLLAAPPEAFERRWRELQVAHLTMGSAVALLLAVAWAFATPAHIAYPLCLAFLVATVVATRCRQVPRLMMIRQGVNGALVVVFAARNLAAEAPVTLATVAVDFLPVAAFAGYAVWIAQIMAATYREGLEREHALTEARDTAERARATKSALISTISHELRTPLNGIIGMAQTLLAARLAPGHRRQVEVIAESGRSLNALLTDILDLSRMEAGRLAIAPAPDDLRRTAEHIGRLHAPVAAQKGLALRAEVDGTVPGRLAFDAVRVRQCLSNLVANAIKFTEQGSVSLAISAEPVAAGPGGEARYRVTCTVADTGIGIDPERQRHLFQPFSQADDTIVQRFGGSGLGLSITRQLAEAMGGGVTLESTPGEGSTFRLTFLAGAVPEGAADLAGDARADAPVQGPAHDIEAVPSLGERRVLVAEDVETNRMLLRLFLQSLGAQVVEAADGRAALEALKGSHFDAALVDLSMPGMDGAEVARRVRAGEAGRPDLPLVAITGDSSGEGVALGAEGFDGLIAKPIDPAGLRGALEGALGARAGASPGAEPPEIASR